MLIGALSPVRAASWVSRVAERISRPSAGTMSPDSRFTMSPGTRSVALTCTRVPPRTTLACGVVILARASTLARAFISCWVPITTLSTTRNATIIAVDHSWISMLTTVTAISIRFIESLSCTRATAHTDGEGSAAITFGPCEASRLAASVADSPDSAFDPNSATTSSTGLLNQLGGWSNCASGETVIGSSGRGSWSSGHQHGVGQHPAGEDLRVEPVLPAGSGSR